MASSEKLDKTTRDGLVKVLSEIADRYGYRALSKRTGIPVSSIENHVRGVSPPKLATLDAYAGVWRAGAQADDLLAYIRGKSPSAEVLIPEGLLFERQLSSRPPMERLRLAGALIQSLMAEMGKDAPMRDVAKAGGD